MNRVKDKVIIVTGGSVGIGKETCIKLAEEGALVAITDIQDEEGRDLEEKINAGEGTARYWHMDVSDEPEVKKTFGEIKDTFGKIDGLVNNAGVSGVNKPTDEIALEDWQKVLDVNINGVFLCTKHVIGYMRQSGGGSIVNLSSIYGIVSSPDVPPYHASKGAVRLMSKTDALFYAKDKIRVNSVHPGFIWTPMVEGFIEESEGDKEENKKNLENLHPLGHVGEPSDVAYGILYLTSDESKFLTGSELIIDGGYTCK